MRQVRFQVISDADGKRTIFWDWACAKQSEAIFAANLRALKDYYGRFAIAPYTDSEDFREAFIQAYPDKLIISEIPGERTDPDRYFDIVANPEGLAPVEIALIADGGNLCFGWSDLGYGVKIFGDE